MCLGRDEFHNLAGAWIKFSEAVRSLSEEREKASGNLDQSPDLGTVLAGPGFGAYLTGIPRPPTHAGNSTGRPPAPSIPASYLIRGDGAELRLEGDVLNLGRSPDNHIVVNDKRVSRRHSVLKWEGAHYVLEDLDTSNGTFVNNQRIQRHVLAQGDVIKLGQTYFTYRLAIAEQN